MYLYKALPLVAVLLLATRPDEGQWLPTQLRAMDWNKLQARGMQLTPDDLWHPERGGLLNAAVQIGDGDRGGCSASFVSQRGLVITNHHCGIGAVAKLSTLKHNYLKEGFVAHSPVRELRTDMVVHVVRGSRDVTAEVHAAQRRANNSLERYEFTQEEIRRLVDEGERDPESGAKDPKTTCHVASFFEGREYHLYYRTRITDIRLVYAPPLGTADYGGNVDNWEWPRHSGDFVMFRTYVAPDGTPRPYHPDNVVYQPDHHMKVSREGISDGDLVLIIGYPGRTSRYLSSVSVQERQGFQFPKRRDVFRQVTRVLEEATASDAEKAIQYTSTIASLANIEKNHDGVVEGLARNAVVDRKISEEEAFTDWARRNGHSGHLDVLQDLLDLDHEEKTTQEKDLLLRLLQFQVFRNLTPLMSTMDKLVRTARASRDGQVAGPDEVAAIGADAITTNLDDIQKPVMAVLLEEIRNLPEGQMLLGSDVLSDSDVPADEMVTILLDSSAMLSGAARVALLRAGPDAIEASDDPLVRLARGIAAEIDEFGLRDRTRMGRRIAVGQRWIDAQRSWRGRSFYPDANSTMRVSIAEVMGYSPRDAVHHQSFTTVAGMLEKNSGVSPFDMPDDLVEAARRRWLSPYRSKDLDDIPVCFLSNGDTTNGNSGSPVINGKGELVGLNFDRVFENVACDFGWNPDRSRNISLDIRFVLWHLESVMPAPQLLREMGIK